MKKILTFTIPIILFFFSGCKNEDKDVKNKFIWIKDGQQLTQGKTYNVVFNVSGIDGKEFYSDVVFNYSRKGFFDYKTFKLTKVDNKHYNFQLTIPDSVCQVTIFLSTEKEKLCSHAIWLPVYTEKGVLEFAASDVILEDYSNARDYLNIFYYERWLHPTNLGIYVSRWQFEKKNKLLDFDSIRKQLKDLELHSPHLKDLPILQLIGYSIIFDTAEVFKAAQKILKSQIFSPMLNNYGVSSLLNTIFEQNFEKSIDLIKKLRSNLCENNPFSNFAEVVLRNRSSVYNQQNYIDSTVAINVVNKRLKYCSDSNSFKYTKLRILSRYFMPDSSLAFETLLKDVLTLSYNYSKNDLHSQGKDPFFIFKIAPGLIPYSVYQYASTTGKYLEGCKYLKEMAEKLFQDRAVNQGIAYLSMANLYSKAGAKYKDSSLKYFYLASELFPDKRKVQKEAKEIFKTNNVDLIIKRAKAKFSFVEVAFANLPIIKYFDGTQVDINKEKSFKLFVYFNTSCGSCEDLFNDIAKFKESLKSDSIKVFILSSEPLNKISRHYAYMILKTKPITNTGEVLFYFGFGTGAPQWIAISKDNKLLAKSDGYAKGSVDWAKLFFKN